MARAQIPERAKKQKKAKPYSLTKVLENQEKEEPRNASSLRPDFWAYHLENSATQWFWGNARQPHATHERVYRLNFAEERSSYLDRGKSMRVAYPALVNYIDWLSTLEDDEDDHVSVAIADRAKSLIGMIAQTNAYPPRVFSHGGDAIVLTWEEIDRAYLMTVTRRKVSLLHVNKLTNQRETKLLDLQSDDGRSEVLRALGEAATSNSLLLTGF
ncbi:hypothetical protein [Devosia beringensis]|uniref:hypothetical protein n=1 Tax=Devosia beringensis TaxID=2657486 RepID=UPI00186BA462|nr:hypothetical protein [Devosia beringensis]